MPILARAFPLLSAFILILHLPAFAWTNGSTFSTATVSSSIGSTQAISAASSAYTSFSGGSWNSPSYYSSSSAFSSLPASFQTVISKFDISQSAVLSETVIQQGLTEALAINNNYLEGNEYKAAMIQPIINLLLSGDYSAATRDLALSNLYSIAVNERIDYSQKSEMADQLIEYMEKVVTDSINGTLDAESAGNDIDKIGEILVKLINSDQISVEEIADLLTLFTNDKVILGDSPVFVNIGSIYAHICAKVVKKENYPLSLIDDSNTDQGKLELAHLLVTAVINNDNPHTCTQTISALNSLLDDSNLPADEVAFILEKTSYILQNQGKTNYTLTATCLSTLMKLSEDTRLSETSRTKAEDLIESYGLNTYNSTLYQENQVLILAENDAFYDSSAFGILTNIVKSAPDKAPGIISIQKEVISEKDSENIEDNLETVGLYTFDSDIVHIKIKDSFPDYIYENTGVHEITHYIEDNLMTTEQKTELNTIWLEADDASDFVREYGQTSRSDYLATTAQAVWAERDSESKPVLERAQQQAANGDATLLKIYNLAEEIWGLS